MVDGGEKTEEWMRKASVTTNKLPSRIRSANLNATCRVLSDSTPARFNCFFWNLGGFEVKTTFRRSETNTQKLPENIFMRNSPCGQLTAILRETPLVATAGN